MFRRSLHSVAARVIRPAVRLPARNVPALTRRIPQLRTRSVASSSALLARPVLRGVASRLFCVSAPTFAAPKRSFFSMASRPLFQAEKKASEAPTPAAPSKPTTAAVMTPASRDLAQHLNDEYKQEEVPDAPAVPENWTMKDFKNENYLFLKREMGDEKITIRVELMPPDDNMGQQKDEDEGWSEEGEQQPSGQEEQNENEENVDDEPAEPDRHVFFEVIVSKPKIHSGALLFHVIGDEKSGDFMINRVTFTDAVSATENSSQAQYKREQSYQGPAVPDMPVDMVNLMSDYLAERGINEQMVKFLYDYSYYKEQREYVSWLKQITVFLTAK